MVNRLLVTLHPVVLLLLPGPGRALVVTRWFTPAAGLMANVQVETRPMLRLTVAAIEAC